MTYIEVVCWLDVYLQIKLSLMSAFHLVHVLFVEWTGILGTRMEMVQELSLTMKKDVNYQKVIFCNCMEV